MRWVGADASGCTMQKRLKNIAHPFLAFIIAHSPWSSNAMSGCSHHQNNGGSSVYLCLRRRSPSAATGHRSGVRSHCFCQWRRRIRHFGVCAVHIVLHVPGRDTDLLQDVQSHRRGTMPADDVVHLPRNDDSTRIVHRLRVPGVLHDLCRGVDDRPIHGMGAATDGAHA